MTSRRPRHQFERRIWVHVVYEYSGGPIRFECVKHLAVLNSLQRLKAAGTCQLSDNEAFER